MTLTLLHTAEAHCARFEAIRDDIAPGVALEQAVRADWLEAAQGGISEALETEIVGWVTEQTEPVLCTCTTLGEVAEQAGAVRIDRPMMEAAARIGGPVILAYCLESTRAPSEALLRRAVGADGDIRPLPLSEHWALFVAGLHSEFEAALATAIRAENPHTGCVVLAQASMAGALALLTDLGVPVLASPELAFRAVLKRAGLQNG
ncbi:MAG: hypothetical protein AAFY35_16045 [Pseudomonadota bacterium]